MAEEWVQITERYYRYPNDTVREVILVGEKVIRDRTVNLNFAHRMLFQPKLRLDTPPWWHKEPCTALIKEGPKSIVLFKEVR
jgi:hypothetical protein